MSSLTERTPTSPPIIAPVTDQAHRPLWSVMIPVYNCLGYLQKTLSSVLAQDPGPEIMQIAVIDDCSSDGDVWALVQQLGKGRVEYFRQEQNRGSLRNFETCLNRSRGHWVHLLHGDDWVAPGF
jgi:glycosyltransferase involved in cell wall biosynthesis